MKKTSIIIAIVVLMLGWAVYEFVTKKNDSPGVTAHEQMADQNGADEKSEVNVEELEVGLNKGSLAPDVALTTLDGEKVKLSDYHGERVLLNFWATWCPPCRAEMPDMEKFHQNTDIEIIAVNLVETETSLSKVHDFIDEYGLSFSVLLDNNSDAATIYGIQPIPTSYLINSDGTIHNKALGALSYEVMVQEFEKMH